MSPALWLALLHHPVLNREGRVVTTAVTNLDIHDIARAARTYGARGYTLVSPIERQRELVRAIVDHWCVGHGSERVPERAEAMRLVSIRATLEEVLAETEEAVGRRPLVVATCARAGRATMTFDDLGGRLAAGEPVVLLFGTGWGLTDRVLEGADGVLEPVTAPGSDYNHMSVRCAAAVVLDRLLASRLPSV